MVDELNAAAAPRWWTVERSKRPNAPRIDLGRVFASDEQIQNGAGPCAKLERAGQVLIYSPAAAEK